MKQYYLPPREAELFVWLTNFKIKIAVHGSTLGLSASQIKDLQDYCDAIIAEIKLTNQKKQEVKKQTAKKNAVKKENIKKITSEVARAKTHKSYKSAIGQDLGVIGSDEVFDADEFVPKIQAEVFPGYVRIEWIKDQIQGINIYTRRKGDTKWRFLARDTRSPYIDNEGLEVQDTPETREYMAIAVIDDEEIGKQSDIVSVVFGGK